MKRSDTYRSSRAVWPRPFLLVSLFMSLSHSHASSHWLLPLSSSHSLFSSPDHLKPRPTSHLLSYLLHRLSISWSALCVKGDSFCVWPPWPPSLPAAAAVNPYVQMPPSPLHRPHSHNLLSHLICSTQGFCFLFSVNLACVPSPISLHAI